MRAYDPTEVPFPPLPVSDDPEIEAAFARMPVQRILDQLMGYSQYSFFAVNDIQVPDVYTDARPEALHDAMIGLIEQLRDLLPEEDAPVGELACQRGYEFLDAIHRSMAEHLFKMGFLFGRKSAAWKNITIYTLNR